MRKVWAREHETAEGRTEGHHRRRRGLWAGWESVEALGKVVASVISGVANCSSFPYFGVCIARIIPVSRKVRTQYGGSSNLVKQGNQAL